MSCPRCKREVDPWPLKRGAICSPKDWAVCIRNDLIDETGRPGGVTAAERMRADIARYANPDDPCRKAVLVADEDCTHEDIRQAECQDCGANATGGEGI